MRRLLAVILMLGIAGVASAVTLSNHQILPDKSTYVGDQMSDGREGGETFATAVPIAALPYNDTGATCDNVNDIAHTCGGTGGPDVVYSFVPAADMQVNVSLCGSAYDTLVGVFNSSYTEIACNDDFCGLQSEVDHVPLTGGQTYYIVVDGYTSTSCGTYTLSIVEYIPPPPLECAPGSLLENEPPCGDNYVDGWNGGCNSTPYVFQPICPPSGDTAVMCGKSGTYLYQGYSYRDTDWFKIWGAGGTMTATAQAEFGFMMAFMYNDNPSCSNFTYDYVIGDPNVPYSLSHPGTMGNFYWVFMAPSSFYGIPCESNYVLQVSGIYANPTDCVSPVEHKSWGAIKNLYK